THFHHTPTPPPPPPSPTRRSSDLPCAATHGFFLLARWPFCCCVIAIRVVASSLSVKRKVVPFGVFAFATSAVGVVPSAKRECVSDSLLMTGGVVSATGGGPPPGGGGPAAPGQSWSIACSKTCVKSGL